MKRLIEIQQELKAPKDQKNSFGGYNYRSCEDILVAVKPLLEKHKLALVISDEVISIDGGFDVTEISKDEKYNKETTRHIIASNRVYIKATATLFDEDGKELIHTSALAREEETKKGMDYSQLTGATSSYARKYALNGLFAIDDTKDSDATNTHGKEVNEPPKAKPKAKETPKIELTKDDEMLIIGVDECETVEQLENFYKEISLMMSSEDAKQELVKACKKRKEILNGQ